MKKGILVGALAMLSIGAMSRIEPPPATGYGATLAPMTADVSYYVDPVNGSDSNPCTSGLPCRTIAHVQTLIPLVMDFNATIYLAAGVYNEVLTFANMDRGLGAPKTITLQGQTWSAFTPATGPQSGQFTSGSGRVATLTGAGWTVNNLRSSHVKITSGTKSGNYYPIASNTADGITLPVPSSYMAAIATATFEIVRPSASISHGAISGPWALIRTSGSVGVNVTSIEIIGTNFGYALMQDAELAPISISSSRIMPGATFGLYGNSLVGIITSTDTFWGTVASGSIIANKVTMYRSTIAGTATVGMKVSGSLSILDAIIDGPGTAISVTSDMTLGWGYLSGLDIIATSTGIRIYNSMAARYSIIAGSITAPNAITVEQNSTAAIKITGAAIISGTGDAIRLAAPGCSVVLADTASIASSAGYGINLAYSIPGSATYDSGSFNGLRVGASATISGFTADINLGDSTTSLTALRALPGKVLVGATTLNRAVSF